MKGKCPFHDENTASFSVSEKKGIYKCFGCGQGGDAVDFIIKHTGGEFIEVIRDLADRYHIPIEEENNNVKTQDFASQHQLIPKEIRAKIRKSGYCILFFCEKELNQFLDKEDQPCLQVSWPIKKFEAESIRKYTPVVFFRADSARAGNNKFWESLRVFLDQDTSVREQLDIYIQKDDVAPQVEQINVSGDRYPDAENWLDFVIRVLPPNPETKHNIIKTVACIHDSLTRGIYTQHFIDEWNHKMTAIAE